MLLEQLLSSFPWNVFGVIGEMDKKAILIFIFHAKCMVENSGSCEGLVLAFDSRTDIQDHFSHLAPVPSTSTSDETMIEE
jgi:hypothetical protein